MLTEIARTKRIAPLLTERIDDESFLVAAWARGALKQELLKLGWPAEDLAGYTPGTPHPIDLDETSWHLRDYQQKAVDNFFDGGSGVVVLPCGAGKTLVGAGAMATAKTTTLILVTNTVSARQWRDELLKRTTPHRRRDRRVLGAGQGDQAGHDRDVPDPHGEAEGRVRAPRAARRARLGPRRLRRGAPAARAGLQAHRRAAGAAPARPHRDARARGRPRGRRVLASSGPKRFDAPWKEIEAQGFISPAACYEVRIDLPQSERLEYAASADDERYRLAATAPAKLGVVKELVAKHAGERILVIGQYLDQIDELADALGAPKLTGATPVDERERLYQEFRDGRTQVLVVSKVANFSVDLPEATVAIQVSGSFGSRQEEAQRLGRLLRPKESRPARRTSTRSSRATPSTRTSRRTASASSPSRATATRSSTRTRSRRPEARLTTASNAACLRPRVAQQQQVARGDRVHEPHRGARPRARRARCARRRRRRAAGSG